MLRMRPALTREIRPCDFPSRLENYSRVISTSEFAHCPSGKEAREMISRLDFLPKRLRSLAVSITHGLIIQNYTRDWHARS